MDIEEFKKLPISEYIPEPLKSNIKLFHVFRDQLGVNIIFKTVTDLVFGVGSNYFGGLGLGHDFVVTEPKLISELIEQNIQEFVNGHEFVLAINKKSEIFSWGLNISGELGHGYQDFSGIQVRPSLIKSLNNMDITAISCGKTHSLCVTSKGKVYGWGNNFFGQVGCGSRTKFALNPIHIPIPCVVKSVYCSNFRSFALTVEGNVYSWGDNICSSLGKELEIKNLFQPEPIDIIGVMDISCTFDNTYFLTNWNKLYFIGVYTEKNDYKYKFASKPQHLAENMKFDALISIDRCELNFDTICLAKSANEIYKIEETSLNKTDCKNFFDYCSKNLQMTHKSIETNVSIDSILLNQIAIPLHPDNSDRFYQRRFESQYEILSSLGQGGFGTAFKVRDIFDKREYCIKKVEKSTIEESYGKDSFKILKREMLASGSVLNENFVKMYGIWCQMENFFYTKKDQNKTYSSPSENNRSFINTIRKIVAKLINVDFEHKQDIKEMYLKMELCDNNIASIIKVRPKIFNASSEPMGILELLIACQLLKDMVTCVRDLHEKEIIHRDIKLENFLYKFEGTDSISIKLCDFGLSVYHLDNENRDDQADYNASVYETSSSHTSSKGTIGFMAPEIKRGKNYSIKSDIYSLGKIAVLIFKLRLKLKKTMEIYQDKKLRSYIKLIVDMVEKMTLKDPDQRASCTFILCALNLFIRYLTNDDLDKMVSEFRLHCLSLIESLKKNPVPFYKILLKAN